MLMTVSPHLSGCYGQTVKFPKELFNTGPVAKKTDGTSEFGEKNKAKVMEDEAGGELKKN